MVQALAASNSITYSATLDKTYFETLTMNSQHFQIRNSRKLRPAGLWNTARCLMLLIGMLGSVLNKIVVDQWNLPAQPPRRMNNQRLWKILYKGEDTLRTVPRSFITNFLKVYHEVKRCNLTNTVYFDQKNTKNYYCWSGELIALLLLKVLRCLTPCRMGNSSINRLITTII